MHWGDVVAGRLHVRRDDGVEQDLAPGDAHVVSAGHQRAWAVASWPAYFGDASPVRGKLSGRYCGTGY